jgi:hypothetical protein
MASQASPRRRQRRNISKIGFVLAALLFTAGLIGAALVTSANTFSQVAAVDAAKAGPQCQQQYLQCVAQIPAVDRFMGSDKIEMSRCEGNWESCVSKKCGPRLSTPTKPIDECPIDADCQLSCEVFINTKSGRILSCCLNGPDRRNPCQGPKYFDGNNCVSPELPTTALPQETPKAAEPETTAPRPARNSSSWTASGLFSSIYGLLPFGQSPAPGASSPPDINTTEENGSPVVPKIVGASPNTYQAIPAGQEFLLTTYPYQPAVSNAAEPPAAPSSAAGPCANGVCTSGSTFPPGASSPTPTCHPNLFNLFCLL